MLPLFWLICLGPVCIPICRSRLLVWNRRRLSPTHAIPPSLADPLIPLALYLLRPLYPYVEPYLPLQIKELVGGFLSDGGGGGGSDEGKKQADNEGDAATPGAAATASGVAHWNTAAYKRHLSSSRPTVVLFSAEWCKPCKAVYPAFASLAEELRESTWA